MKNLNYTILTILFFCISSVAQPQTNQFRGTVTGVVIRPNSKLTIQLYKNNTYKLGKLLNIPPDTIIDVPLNNEGAFNTTFDASSDYFYMALNFYSGDSILNLLFDDFLLNPNLGTKGDSINLKLDVARNRAVFEGTGAEKYNCQFLLNSFKPSRIIEGPFYYKGPMNKTQSLASRELAFFANLSYQNTILQQYKERLDNSVFNRLEVDLRARNKAQFVQSLMLFYYLYGDEVTKSLSEYFAGNLTKSRALEDERELETSLYYADFLLAKEQLEYKITHHTNGNIVDKKHFFDWMYSKLSTSYDGVLRDRLLTTWFLTSTKEYPAQQNDIIQQAIGVVQAQYYKVLLTANARSIAAGEKIFPFSFIDENDVIHTPTDYLDKVVVMDFWFTGCGGCTAMPPILSNIKEKFKARKDLVFLSINIESSKKSWIEKGLKSELYTFAGQTHLKTKGNGRLDPFMLHYKIQGCPHIMLLGKNGKIISVSIPTDELRKDNGQRLTQLIKTELELSVQK